MADQFTIPPQEGARNAKLSRIAVIGLGVADAIVAMGITGSAEIELLTTEKVGPADMPVPGTGPSLAPIPAHPLIRALLGDQGAIRQRRALPHADRGPRHCAQPEAGRDRLRAFAIEGSAALKFHRDS